MVIRLNDEKNGSYPYEKINFSIKVYRIFFFPKPLLLLFVPIFEKNKKYIPG